MSRSYLMSFDAGSGGGRCLLVPVDASGSGTLLVERRWQQRAAPGAEGTGVALDLDRVWTRLCAAAREALERAGAGPDAVLGVAATSMRHATIVLDAGGAPLLAAANRDARAVGEALALAAEQGDAWYARTGHWPHPISTAARLRWLASHDDARWRRAASVLGLGDWLTLRLCGELATDPSQASGTLLLDLERREWASDLADRLGIPGRLLPPLRDAGTRIGSLVDAAARDLGLRAGTPVALGGGDTQCALLAAGAVTPDAAAVIAGTTVPLQWATQRCARDPRQRLWTECHVLPGLWVLESNAGAMGDALEWLARAFFPDAARPVARFLAEATLSQPGACGIVSTLGAGVMDGRHLRLPLGTLNLSHLSALGAPEQRAHLARAVVEGLACALRANLAQLREVAGAPPRSLAFAGGLARSDSFVQLVCDVVGLPVELDAGHAASALGAAACAGVGAGVFGDLTGAATALAGPRRVLRPDPQRSRVYGGLYDRWERVRAARAEGDSGVEQAILPAVLAGLAAAPKAAAPSVRPKLLVTAELDEASLAELRELGELEYASFRSAMRLLTGPSLVEALRGVQVFVTEVDVVDAGALRALPDLRAIAVCRGDVVNVDVGACTAFGIPVLHAPGRNADAVADLTLAFLLMLARRLPEACAFLRRPGIEPGDLGRMGQAFTSLQGRELWQRTVGLVGLGAVGRAVAKRLAAFGARILVYDPHLSPERIALAGGEPVSLDALLEQSDFVSLHAAVSDESRGMIGARELARMKPGACLVNTARAGLVDEQALLDALAGGRLAGAALDVFSVEPPGSDHPLLALDRVIATPHIGGNTSDVASHQGRMIAADLRALLEGRSPRHLRNPEVLARFSWRGARPEPDAAALAALAGRPGPAVSDLQRRATRPEPAPAAATAASVPAERRERFARILQEFAARLEGDTALRSFASGQDVTLRFTLHDFGLRFFLRLQGGAVRAAVGDPDAAPDVELKMPASVFDGMFTGRVNPMQEAMGGRLSFSGDAARAMTLQRIQADLARLYCEAREQVGDPGDLEAAPRPELPAGRPAAPGDVRHELVRVVEELFAAGLVTATGGNVSARIPGATDELWITPSQFFKGALRPEHLVRIHLDGRVLDPEARSPSSEQPMHCAVYRARPEAQAVIHAHAPFATLLANAELPFEPVSTEAAFFGEIPQLPFIMPGTEQLARAVGEALRGSWAVLMRNHGLLVAGRSLRRAADMVEIVERSAQIILGCHALGRPVPRLPPDVVKTLQGIGDLMA